MHVRETLDRLERFPAVSNPKLHEFTLRDAPIRLPGKIMLPKGSSTVTISKELLDEFLGGPGCFQDLGGGTLAGTDCPLDVAGPDR